MVPGFSPAGGGIPNRLALLDPSGKQPKRIIQGTGCIRGVAWSADGSELFAADQDGTLTVSEFTHGPREISRTTVQGPVWEIKIDPAGQTLAVSTANGLLLWHPLEANATPRKISEIPTRSIAWLADGRWLIADCGDRIALFDSASGHCLRSLILLDNDRYALISADGHWAGSAGVEKDLILIAKTESGGQLTFTPAQFAARFGWVNDSTRVRLEVPRRR